MHPTAFHLGPLTVNWYGILVALGFLVGLWTASRRGLRDGFSAETILDVGPWLILGTIAGARALYVISFWNDEFAGRPFTEVFAIWRGGLVFYGGLIGASLAVLIWMKVKHLPVWKTADVLAPSIALGSAFGRIGCLMYGCCYGRECHLPWAITYPQTGDHRLPTTPVHPTQLYDSALSLLLYVALAQLYRRKPFHGSVFAAYLVGYAITRSISELFRGDYPHFYFGWVTPAHLLSVPVFIVGLVLWFVLPRLDGAQQRATAKA